MTKKKPKQLTTNARVTTQRSRYFISFVLSAYEAPQSYRKYPFVVLPNKEVGLSKKSIKTPPGQIVDDRLSCQLNSRTARIERQLFVESDTRRFSIARSQTETLECNP